MAVVALNWKEWSLLENISRKVEGDIWRALPYDNRHRPHDETFRRLVSGELDNAAIEGQMRLSSSNQPFSHILLSRDASPDLVDDLRRDAYDCEGIGQLIHTRPAFTKDGPGTSRVLLVSVALPAAFRRAKERGEITFRHRDFSHSYHTDRQVRYQARDAACQEVLSGSVVGSIDEIPDELLHPAIQTYDDCDVAIQPQPGGNDRSWDEQDR